MPPVRKPPINGSFPLIVVKRRYYDEFSAGTKTVEYRLHKKPFTERAFYAERWVRIAYNYNIDKNPSLLAVVTRFVALPAFAHFVDLPLDEARAKFEALREVYPELTPETELAAIHLDVQHHLDPRPRGACHRASGMCILSPEHCATRCPYAPPILIAD
jgi:hypothetical protein